MTDFQENNKFCLFFGMYNELDITALKEFKGKKYVLWAGSDIDRRLPNVNNIIHRMPSNVQHFAISESVSKRLPFEHTVINFSLVNMPLYKSIVTSDNRVKRIYVYDGNQNETVYNCTLCRSIAHTLKDKYEFIFRSDISFNETDMIAFYQSCFLGIRLCMNDGNANTVLEMGLLGLPVLHNSSIPNAVPWINDMDYICEKIDYIFNNFHDKKEIIKKSVIKYINNDVRTAMTIFVPMYGRHDVTLKNLHLLTFQNYSDTHIIVIYSNDEDEKFCKTLSHYKNIYPIRVENKPLSKKYQFGAEFGKIFYPHGIIINGSDDFLSLNFASVIYDKFKSDEGSYFGSNFWYVGDVDAMLLYKFTYNDSMRVVGCGRSFKYTLLNTLNWQVFPLNRNSGIDGASKDMIMDDSVPISYNDPNCFTFSFKEPDTNMITPMANLLKSNHSTYEIIAQSHLCQILYANTLLELQNAFKLKPSLSEMNKFLFITLVDDNLKQTNPIMLNSYYMKSVLSTNFDIIDLRDLEYRKSFDYELIFIDGIALNTRTTKLDRLKLFKYLSKIKHIKKVLLSHDIHDYSYDFDNSCQPSYVGVPLKPIYENNMLKDNFLQFLKGNNIEYIIGICDCPEFDNMVKYYSSQIKQFYLMTHHIPENIFRYKRLDKEYDILMYGWSNEIVYPFRNRLKEIITKLPYRIKIIPRSSNINKMPVEHELADLINKSWIVITCISNFSYLVRKYFEIGACGAIPCGNINKQGREIFDNNIISITEYMSDHEISRIITYYLNNKSILMKMSNCNKLLTMKYNYNTFMKNLLEIKDNIIFNNDTNLSFEKQKEKYEPYNDNIIHVCSDTMILRDWVTNQLSNITADNILTVTVLQDKSTPGIKTIVPLDIAEYILSFDISTNLSIKVFVFGKTQISVMEQSHENIFSVHINILVKGMYNIMILCTNPTIGSSYTLSFPKIEKVSKESLNYKLIPSLKSEIFSNVFIGSMSIAGEVEKLANTFNMQIVSKDDILKKQYNAIKKHQSYKMLILLGLYSPHHWTKYKSLFDLFDKVIVVFTGTDILQLNNEKVNKLLKYEIISYLKSSKVTCGALNHRNMNEIYSLHKLKTTIFSIPLKTNMMIPNYIECSNKVACYMGNNLEWYCFDLIVKVATVMPSHKFYIYKYGGFNSDFIKANARENIIYNTQSIENIEEFMSSKKCNLRLTIHDGEPMTGIESIIMKKPFIFNHDMKYAIKVSLDVDEICNAINNLPPFDESVCREAFEYYYNRNSSKTFERNVKCYYPIYTEKINLVSKHDYHVLSSDCDALLNMDIVKVRKGKKYRVLFNGYSDGYVKLNVLNANIINNTYNNIEIYETCTFIDFIAMKEHCVVQFIVKTNVKCNVYIRKLQILC